MGRDLNLKDNTPKHYYTGALCHFCLCACSAVSFKISVLKEPNTLIKEYTVNYHESLL